MDEPQRMKAMAMPRRVAAMGGDFRKSDRREVSGEVSA